MDKQQIKDEYRTLIKEKRFAELSRFIKKTNSKPAEYCVRMGVKNYLEEKRALKTKLFFIIKLLEITEINLNDNIIMDVCKLMLDLGTPYTLVFFSQKVEIKEELYINIQGYIQKNYSDYIRDGKLVEITKLMEVSKIKPSENIVFDGYRDYLLEGNIISFVNLKNRTKIEPKDELILEMFNFYKNKSGSSTDSTESDSGDFWEKRVGKLSRATGIDFKL